MGVTLCKNSMQGVNMTALREVKLLKELDSQHIVRLMDVFVHKNNLALVSAYSSFCLVLRYLNP